MKKRNLFPMVFVLLFITMSCSWMTQAEYFISPPQAGETILWDDFSNSDYGWNTWNQNNSAVDYDSGGLRFFINQQKYDYWSAGPLRLEDVQVDVVASRVTGPDDNHYGVICRYQNRDNFYAFLISSDGYHGIMKVKDGEYSLLTGEDMQYSEAILQGESTNYLRAECIGQNLVFYVNGQKISVASDVDFKSGRVGLLVGTYEAAGVDILFDNFAVYQP
jgi:hypothetical protein